MLKSPILLAICLALLAAPASAAPVSAAPVRHLKYAFSIYPTGRVDLADVGKLEGPDTGVMSVDINGTAPDGGMLVSASEWWWNAIRPEQTRSCEVYPTGAMKCGNYPTPTVPEQVLFPLLAREYFAPSANGAPWNRSYLTNYGNGWLVTSTDANLHLLAASDDGRILHVESSALLAQAGIPSRKVYERSQIAYDKVAGIPVNVYEVRQASPTNSVFTSASVYLKLTSDS